MAHSLNSNYQGISPKDNLQLPIGTLPGDKQEEGGTGTSLMHIEDSEARELIEAARKMPATVGAKKIDFSKAVPLKVDQAISVLESVTGEETKEPSDENFVRTFIQLILPQGDVNVYQQYHPEEKLFIVDPDGRWFDFTGDIKTTQKQLLDIQNSKPSKKEIDQFTKQQTIEGWEAIQAEKLQREKQEQEKAKGQVTPAVSTPGISILKRKEFKDIARKIEDPKKYIAPNLMDISERKQPFTAVDPTQIVNIKILPEEQSTNASQFQEKELVVLDPVFSQKGPSGEFSEKTQPLIAIPSTLEAHFIEVLRRYQGADVNPVSRASQIAEYLNELAKEKPFRSNGFLIQFTPVDKKIFHGRMSSEDEKSDEYMALQETLKNSQITSKIIHIIRKSGIPISNKQAERLRTIF